MTAKQKAELEKEMKKLLTDIKNGVYFNNEEAYIEARDRFLEKIKKYNCESWAMRRYMYFKSKIDREEK